MENNDAEQLQIRLTTKQPHYAVPDVPYSIEGNVTTAELNTFVHALLTQSAKDVKSPDFDFLVLGEYLPGRLCDYLREKSVSSEDTIEIEYVERFPAPEPLDCLLHDDWVAAVKTCGKWILTGCYDNTVNLWTIKGEHKLTIPGHTMPVKAVAWVSLDDQRGKFISCSQDQYAMLWEWQIKTNSVECVSVCKGHERGLHCVDVSPDGRRFTTGGWDTMLKIWLTEDEIDHSQSKRARTDMSTTKIPKMTLQGHRECISSVQWMSNETILTGSWDHTMKVWDLNLEGIKTEISANKSIFDANYSPLNRLIVTASADKNIRVYDSRMTQGAVVCNTFYGHKEWVQCVMWSKEDEHLFISGSYDNQSKLWDCRSPKAPLYDLIGHNDKVMDIDWSNPKYIVSGGSDNTVRVYKAHKAMQTDKMDTK